MSSKWNQLRKQFREQAATIDKIDEEVYDQYGADPLEPIIGMGAPDTRLCLFGRDPGRHEVEHRMPFIGAGGQKIRRELYQLRHGCEMPHFEASLEIGDTVFWANTVPYKPIGNKAWSMAVKKRFQPLMAQVLLEFWNGTQILTLGREAFLWFGINQSKAERDRLMAFWNQPDRFENSISVRCSHEGAEREFEILPLPHPSPLNATWYHAFPELLRERLRQVGYSS